MNQSRRSRRNSAWHVIVILLSLPSAGFGQQQPGYVHPATDPDHKLTGREFLKDIGYNFAALFSTQSILPLAAGTAAYAAATAPEQRLERHFAPGDLWGAWSTPGKYIGHSLVLGGISGALFAVSRKSRDRKFRSLSYSLIHGSIMTAAITEPLKVGFHRLRPNGEDHMAFPSGHSSGSFMFATIFADHYGWKAALPGYAIATYVAATRLEERKHHLTDVVAGATIGYLVGRTVSRRVQEGKPSRFAWQVCPTRGGFTGSVRLALP